MLSRALHWCVRQVLACPHPPAPPHSSFLSSLLKPRHRHSAPMAAWAGCRGRRGRGSASWRALQPCASWHAAMAACRHAAQRRKRDGMASVALHHAEPSWLAIIASYDSTPSAPPRAPPGQWRCTAQHPPSGTCRCPARLQGSCREKFNRLDAAGCRQERAGNRAAQPCCRTCCRRYHVTCMPARQRLRGASRLVPWPAVAEAHWELCLH